MSQCRGGARVRVARLLSRRERVRGKVSGSGWLWRATGTAENAMAAKPLATSVRLRNT